MSSLEDWQQQTKVLYLFDENFYFFTELCESKNLLSKVKNQKNHASCAKNLGLNNHFLLQILIT